MVTKPVHVVVGSAAVIGTALVGFVLGNASLDASADASEEASEAGKEERDQNDTELGSGELGATKSRDRLPILYPPPSPETLVPPKIDAPANGGRGFSLYAAATYYDAMVFAARGKRPNALGTIRRGTIVRTKHALGGPGCRGGSWHEVAGGGFVCSSIGFLVDKKAAEPTEEQLPPDVTKPLPFRYAQVMNDGAPRFYRIPTEDEEALADEKETEVEVVERRMEGDYFVAVHRPERDRGREFLRTVRGRYVRKSDVELLEPPALRGVLLGGEASLPLAIVHADDAVVMAGRGGALRRVGRAAKYARLELKRERSVDGKAYVELRDGKLIDRAAVRVVKEIARPRDVEPEEKKWIHIDLDEQTLVAYEGDEPVFATLVASGKEGYDTPEGLYRVRHKYISTTMSGADPIDGFYEVEEVPWTMYYYRGYALHGAYWHDNFGQVRSHGCTNLAPADARYLYYWTSPTTPEDWHGVRGEGTRVYFTRDDR